MDMKKVFTFVLLIFICSFSNAQEQFVTNLLYPSYEKLQSIGIMRPKPGGMVEAKPEVDLSVLLPPPGMQGTKQGSCSAWSIAYGLMTYLKNRQLRWNVLSGHGGIDKRKVYSPSFLYNALSTDNSCQVGIDLPTTLDYCLNVGVLPLSQFEYDPNKCDRKPTTNEKNLAAGNKILSYNRVFDIFQRSADPYVDTSALIAQLNDSLPVVIGIQLDNDFKNYNSRFQTTRLNGSNIYVWNHFTGDCPFLTAGCYHAMLVVGYNKKIKAFKVMNSWDQKFGTAGSIWIGYDVIRQAVKEAYVATLPPLHANLVRPAASLAAPSIEHGFVDSIIMSTTWVKAGYYRQFENIRVGCRYLNAKDKLAVLQISDANTGSVIASWPFTVGEDFKAFGYKGHDIKIKAVSIGNAGRNFFKKAVFFTVIYDFRTTLNE
jgi:hypothetical protein